MEIVNCRIIVDQIGLTTRQKSANYEKNDIRDELMFAKRLMFKIFSITIDEIIRIYNVLTCILSFRVLGRLH